MNKIFITILFCLFSSFLFAQNQVKENSLSVMKSNGKIYVVVAVVLVILCGLFLYVLKLDKKISKLEKEKINN